MEILLELQLQADFRLFGKPDECLGLDEIFRAGIDRILEEKFVAMAEAFALLGEIVRAELDRKHAVAELEIGFFSQLFPKCQERGKGRIAILIIIIVIMMTMIMIKLNSGLFKMRGCCFVKSRDEHNEIGVRDGEEKRASWLESRRAIFQECPGSELVFETIVNNKLARYGIEEFVGLESNRDLTLF